MIPEIILTVYLGWLLLMSVIKHTIDTVDGGHDLVYMVGGHMGILAKYATIFLCLYYGGFYE